MENENEQKEGLQKGLRTVCAIILALAVIFLASDITQGRAPSIAWIVMGVVGIIGVFWFRKRKPPEEFRDGRIGYSSYRRPSSAPDRPPKK
jgi:hypothetical protein